MWPIKGSASDVVQYICMVLCVLRMVNGVCDEWPMRKKDYITFDLIGRFEIGRYFCKLQVEGCMLQVLYVYFCVTLILHSHFFFEIELEIMSESDKELEKKIKELEEHEKEIHRIPGPLSAMPHEILNFAVYFAHGQ